MKRIICVGHCALDYVYRIEAFPQQPTKVRALEHIESGGGSAANAAAAVARLGGMVDLWSHVGSDETGQKILRLLNRDGVPVDFVQVVPGARSSTSAVIVDGKGERFIVGERDHGMTMEPDRLPLDRIKGAAVVYSDLRWLEGTKAAFSEARRHGVITLIDADIGGAPYVDQFLGLADFVIFSNPALHALEPGMDDRERLGRTLDQGPRHVGVTKGADGYFWVSRDGHIGKQMAFPVAAVDTTGAGDAFHGTFAWGLAQGYSDAACARLAAAAAALKCRKLGARAGLPSRSELEGFLAAHA